MGRPESRSFAATARFTKVTPPRAVRVLCEGRWLPGELVATNGPRQQVLVLEEGGQFRRWVDAVDVEDVGDP